MACGRCHPREERTCICRAVVEISHLHHKHHDGELEQHSWTGRVAGTARAAEQRSSVSQSAKQRQPMTRAFLAKYSNVTFELLIIFPSGQPNKCYERVILSIHCTRRVKTRVRRAPGRAGWQPLLLLWCVQSSTET